MDIAAYIEQNDARFLEELAALCAIPSVATRPEALQRAAAWVDARLRSLGASVRTLEGTGAPLLFAEVGPPDAARTLLIYNHYDVQPEDPYELWDSDPFVLMERDGLLYARGVADNKANLLSRLQAVEAWQATRGDLPLRIRWLIEGEEESGSATLPALCEKYGHLWADSDGCLWEAGSKDAEGRMVLYAGVKGIAAFELRAHGARSDAHSALATLIPNAAWRLTWALSTLKDAEENILIEGLLDHVAEPTAAELAFLEKIPFDDESMKETHGVERFVTGVSGREALRRHLYEPTCTINGLESGYTGEGLKTVLPHYAMAKLDFRLVPDLTPGLVEKLLRAHLDRKGFEDIEIVAYCGEHPARGQVESRVVDAALQATREVTAQEPILWPHMPATGPMYPVAARFGIPAVGFGTGNVDSRIHAPNENIRLEDYREGIRAAARFYELFAG